MSVRRRVVHAPSCGDPDELYGPHEACLCADCLGTGFVEADPARENCACPAAQGEMADRLHQASVVAARGRPTR